jgi:glycosyltransferase involved in cell wall biosynthesis
VGSRIGGLADVAEEGSNARLFDLKEGAKGLASALQGLLQDPEALKSARRASLRMSTRFDFNSTLDHYEAVLKESALA